MTGPPPPAPAQRPRSPWLILGLLVLLLVALGLWARPRSEAPPEAPRGTTRLSHDVVVERVQSVAKLLTSETTVRDVVVYENTWLNSTKRSLLVVTGKVNAGIDLGAGTEVRIDDQAKRITVTLPPAKILGVEVLTVRTYDESAGLWNPFRPADRDVIHQRVRARLVRSGEELGVVEHANQSARTLLQTLLATDGYTVDVTFRARPVVPARG